MTAFFCDSNCELWWETANSLGIKNIIKMPYTISGEEKFYDLGKDYDAKDFFDKIRKGNIPITSALNPENYKEYFEPFFKAGEDIFYVSFSSEMSATFKYMDMAVAELSKTYPDVKFTRYDTKGISLSAGLLVYIAAKAHNEGKSTDEIIALLDTLKNYTNCSIVVDDLQHLKRGGRLSGFQAFAGGMLNIKPIIKLSKLGTLFSAAKVMGRNKAFATIADEIIADAANTAYPIAIMDADCRAESDRIAQKIKAALPDVEIWQQSVGPVIGTHCGPGTIGICYIGNKERPDNL
ncbi:MAG: DegV family protein [Clostridia bacterium]